MPSPKPPKSHRSSVQDLVFSILESTLLDNSTSELPFYSLAYSVLVIVKRTVHGSEEANSSVDGAGA